MTKLTEIALAARRQRCAELHDRGRSTRCIGAELGIDKSTVWYDLVAIGLIKPDFDAMFDGRLDEVIEWYEDGDSMAVMAGRLGISVPLMKWRIRTLLLAGGIGRREVAPANKGKKMPLRPEHQEFADALFAVKGWEKLPRKVLARELGIPLNDFLNKYKVLRNHGLVQPRKQGKKSAAVTAEAAVRTVARNSTKDKGANLWALALGRKVQCQQSA